MTLQWRAVSPTVLCCLNDPQCNPLPTKNPDSTRYPPKTEQIAAHKPHTLWRTQTKWTQTGKDAKGTRSEKKGRTHNIRANSATRATTHSIMESPAFWCAFATASLSMLPVHPHELATRAHGEVCSRSDNSAFETYCPPNHRLEFHHSEMCVFLNWKVLAVPASRLQTIDVKTDTNLTGLEATLVPFDGSRIHTKENPNHQPKKTERLSQEMHLKIPLSSRGLKLSNSKPGYRVSALHFFLKKIPPMTSWRQAHSDKS
jgi:hypothetical protein